MLQKNSGVEAVSLTAPQPLQSHIKRSAPGPAPDNCTPIVPNVQAKQRTKEKMEAERGGKQASIMSPLQLSKYTLKQYDCFAPPRWSNTTLLSVWRREVQCLNTPDV